MRHRVGGGPLLMLASAWSAAAPGSTSKWEVAARGAATTLAADTLASLVAEHTVCIFSRGRSQASARVRSHFEDLGIPYYELSLDEREDGADLQKALSSHTKLLFPPGGHEFPAIFIKGQHIDGGSYKIGQAFKTGELEHWVQQEPPDEQQVPRTQ